MEQTKGGSCRRTELEEARGAGMESSRNGLCRKHGPGVSTRKTQCMSIEVSAVPLVVGRGRHSWQIA